MATTTNYSFPTPDDTALVKDGASAIRSLGSAVDTTVKALNPETTLGDLAYRSSTANVKTRLALGTAGQILAVNSGATAPEWITSASGGMTLISTTTLSGATVTLSSIPQTYTNLQLVINGMNWNTANTQPRVRLNGATTGYYYSGVLGGSVHNRSNQDWFLTSNDWDRTDTTNATTFNFYNYASTTARKPFDYSGICTQVSGGILSFIFGGSWNDSNNAITSIDIYASGNTFAGGTALLYGVK